MKKKKIAIHQLTLFDIPKSENDMLWEAITDLRESHNKVRKRLFKEIKDLKSSLLEVQSKHSILVAFIQEWRQLDLFIKEKSG